MDEKKLKTLLQKAPKGFNHWVQGDNGIDQYVVLNNSVHSLEDLKFILRVMQKIEGFREEVDRLKAKIDMLEKLRPHWAEGHTKDSVAAQSARVALIQLWDMLGVSGQTAAIYTLGQLINKEQNNG